VRRIFSADHAHGAPRCCRACRPRIGTTSHERTRATLYYYFAGRDDVVQFFVNDKLERTAQAVEKALATEGSVVERLEAVLVGILRAFATYPRMCV
jgi:hypothetical protein